MPITNKEAPTQICWHSVYMSITNKEAPTQITCCGFNKRIMQSKGKFNFRVIARKHIIA
jgi:hypothetical protein